MSKLESSAEDAAVENIKSREHKFKMFFSGLIFAILSFMGTHPIQTTSLFLKILETISLSSLLLSGIILLVQLTELKAKIPQHYCLIKKICFNYTYNKSGAYWFLFIVGMTLMVIDRSILSFIN
jgi:hypothetical protein